MYSTQKILNDNLLQQGGGTMFDRHILQQLLPLMPMLQQTAWQHAPHTRQASRSPVDKLFDELLGVPEDNMPEHAAAAPAGSVTLAQVIPRLRAEREARGLSLRDLQEATGIPRSQLSRLENGIGTNPTIATLDRIARALGFRLLVSLVDTAAEEPR